MFPDFSRHPEWLRGQTRAWCNQLASQTGKYEFTWNYEIEGIPAEEVLAERLSKLVRGKVLDVGCGHGAFTNRWADLADEVVGYDMTEGFLATADRNRKPNVRFVPGYTLDGLPFADGEFDMAYTKKGPTSWYMEASRILKPCADVLALHPGDGDGEGAELGLSFPGLFDPPAKGKPILDKTLERLAKGGLHVLEVRTIRETVYIKSAEDVLTLKCFGQNERLSEIIRERCFDDIRVQFDRYRSEKGFRTTNFYYLIHAQA